MRRALGLLVAVVVLGGLIAAAVVYFRDRAAPEAGSRSPVPLLAGGESAEGFARATGPQPIEFPRDHGPHPDFQTEWWYYTGNLDSAGGRHFGYQLTFFRRALLPPTLRLDRDSGWAADQIYLAHFALTDVSGNHYSAAERFARGAAGLAGAQVEPYRVWLDNWSVELVGPDQYRLQASQGDLALDLRLHDRKGPVLQADGGYSRKGPEPGNASFYFSQTRLESSGTVRAGGATHDVTGLSWMDHEYSTSALGSEQVGWDWFALQLSDGSELMVFQLRRADGSLDPFSSGTLIAPDGSTQSLSQGDFTIEVRGEWRSPHSGAVYPAAWTVRVPEVELTIELEPYLADQELNVSFTYWEGAVRLSGRHGGQTVTGSGYVEMTGYSGLLPVQP